MGYFHSRLSQAKQQETVQTHVSAAPMSFAPGSSCGSLVLLLPHTEQEWKSLFPEIQNDNIDNYGVDYNSMTDFPYFEDGDVHIIITGSRQYQLHSAVLRSNSPVLARLLNEDNAARLSSKAIKRGATVKFRIIMTDNTADDGGLPYTLKTVPLNEEGKPTEHRIVGLDLENGRVVPSEVLAYESVFSALYNASIDLGDFETDGMVHVLTRVWSVVDAAEQLQCVCTSTASLIFETNSYSDPRRHARHRGYPPCHRPAPPAIDCILPLAMAESRLQDQLPPSLPRVPHSCCGPI